MINKENYKYFNLSAIEIACNIPARTIIQAINGNRSLPTKHADKLNEFLTGLIACDIKQPNQETKEIIKPLPRVKSININEYQLLLSGKYRNIKTGDIITKEEFNAIKKAT